MLQGYERFLTIRLTVVLDQSHQNSVKQWIILIHVSLLASHTLLYIEIRVYVNAAVSQLTFRGASDNMLSCLRLASLSSSEKWRETETYLASTFSPIVSQQSSEKQ